MIAVAVVVVVVIVVAVAVVIAVAVVEAIAVAVVEVIAETEETDHDVRDLYLSQACLKTLLRKRLEPSRVKEN